MAQQRRPFTAEDLYLHRKITDVSCAPGLELAACVVKSVDRGSDSYQTTLWEFPLDGSPGRQLTKGPGSDSSPKWSPDGARLAFLSTRSGSSQIHVLERAGDEARQLTNLPQGAGDLAWSPDGRFLVATAPVMVDPDLRGRRGPSPQGTPRSKVEVAWRLPYKSDGMGYMLRREIHLFHVDARTGEAKQLTDGPFDVMGFDISPDGSRVAYSRTRSGRFAHRTDLWTCAVDGGGHKQATSDIATVLQPVWSPDGARVVFAGATKEGDAQSRFWLLDVASGVVLKLGDESVEPASGEVYYWTKDGNAVVFARAHRGRHHPALLAVPSGQLTAMRMPDRQLSAFGGTQRALVYCVDHPSLPSELWTCSIDGSGERKLSDLNPWWRERAEIQAEIRSFEVPDGKGGTEAVEGWLIRAKGARGPGPLLNDAHGGPASYALMDFDTNVFWQALCSRGWSVLRTARRLPASEASDCTPRYRHSGASLTQKSRAPPGNRLACRTGAHGISLSHALQFTSRSDKAIVTSWTAGGACLGALVPASGSPRQHDFSRSASAFRVRQRLTQAAHRVGGLHRDVQVAVCVQGKQVREHGRHFSCCVAG
jgi:dipeptidyl aminopeptidase/acylaminoacyl peptidase